MLEEQTDRNSAIQLASIGGLELGLWVGLRFVVQTQELHHPWVQIISSLLLFYIWFGVYVSAQHYKVYELDGKMSFRQGWRFTAWLLFFASIVATLVRFVYLEWIDTSYLSETYVVVEEVLKKSVASSTASHADKALVIEQATETLKRMFVPIRYAMIGGLSDMMRVFTVAPLAALIASRRESRFISGNKK